MSSPHNTLVLLILDGWGYRDQSFYNAISAAKTPQWDALWAKKNHHCLLDASGLEVGLPQGQMGNSEVGHMHIGAGRIVFQDFTRINSAMETDEFAQNRVLTDMLDNLEKTGKALHVMGLFSDGGVHSHVNHLLHFLRCCQARSFSRIYLHLFLDGRDTPPKSALQYLASLQSVIADYPSIQIASISGRYYAMDRDKRWSRVEPVYHLLTEGLAEQHFAKAEQAIEHYYAQGITDEFIPPTHIGNGKTIEDGDALFFFNFRADRAREITEAFINPAFSGFERKVQPRLSAFVTMTSYAKNLPTSVVFPEEQLEDTLGEVLARHGLKQLRLAETEKYAHVTFFFNGGREQAFAGEERQLVASPKVATYDLQPEMSARELTDDLVEAIQQGTYQVIIANYANADMVGHTGDFDATVKAIECLDHCIQRVWKALQKQQGKLLITADHGNAEIMFDDHTQQPHTAHTCQPVPFVFAGEGWHFHKEHGSLKDIAPTLLMLLGIDLPVAMTGESLLVKNQ